MAETNYQMLEEVLSFCAKKNNLVDFSGKNKYNGNVRYQERMISCRYRFFENTRKNFKVKSRPEKSFLYLSSAITTKKQCTKKVDA